MDGGEGEGGGILVTESIITTRRATRHLYLYLFLIVKRYANSVKEGVNDFLNSFEKFPVHSKLSMRRI